MTGKYPSLKTLVSLLPALLFALSFDVYADIALVTHTGNPIQSLEIADARRIFLKQTSKFPDGNRVQVAMLKAQTEVRNEFESKVLNMSPSQVKTYWAKYIFTGQNRPPQTFHSEEAMKQWVAVTPGSLGYIHVTEVDDTVKVLKTIPSTIHRP